MDTADGSGNESSSHEIIERILASRDYYAILGVTRETFSQDVIRKNYIKLARKIHPDKHRNDAQATQAFQSVKNAIEMFVSEAYGRLTQLSTAYETLTNPSSRVSYDYGGAAAGAQNVNPNDVLDAVLRAIYQDFFEGDFEQILSMVDMLNEAAAQDPRYHRADGQPPLDRQRVRESLVYMKEQLVTAGKVKEELREPLVQFCDLWYRFKDCRWYQIFARVQLGIEMLHVLCRMPSQTQIIQLPSMLTSVMSVTASTLWFTKKSLDMIASVGISSVDPKDDENATRTGVDEDLGDVGIET